MSMEYVREYYRVPAKRGGRVRTEDGEEGTITSATHYLFVRLDGQRKSIPFYPLELKYLEG